MHCLIYDPNNQRYLEFKHPLAILQTNDLSEVKSCLNKALEHSDCHVVGFISYDASPAFDEAFVSHALASTPLLCFGLFESYEVTASPSPKRMAEFSSWIPSEDFNHYNDSIQKIKHHISEGDTYQVNYTFKLNSQFHGDPKQLFFNVQQEVQAEYAAYIELDSHVICTFSPELFFTWEKGTLTSKPMKGTAPRGLTTAEDKRLSEELAASEKNRAENIMIVDMIRNDMGRVAKAGSVSVDSMFDVSRYPYVLQMTSTVTAQAEVPLLRLFESLFPCASITGAPKYRTIEIIKNLESAPRGVYTGTIGHISPEGKARFNVAIRTLVIDKATGNAEYGVGSGIVWDSEAHSEYQECLMKSKFLWQKEPDFQLIESLLWSETDGYYLLENHLERLFDSADYFSFKLSEKGIRDLLFDFQKSIAINAAKVRLLLSKAGDAKLQWESLADVKSSNLTVGLAHDAINSNNRFLYHKSTNRQVYEAASKGRPECDDVILWNENGEATEFCRSNLVAEIEGDLITPPVSSGLLAGTFRRHLLETGKIKEKAIPITDLKRASRLYAINSVRKWMDATLI